MLLPHQGEPEQGKAVVGRQAGDGFLILLGD